MGGRLAQGTRTVASASAVPYGFTLAIWGSGAALAATTGLPDVLDVFCFIFAAIVGFIAVGAVAYGGFTPREARPPSPFSWWQWLDVPAVGVPVAAATGLGWLIAGWPAWALGGAIATAGYSIIAAGQLTLAQRSSPPGASDRDGED